MNDPDFTPRQITVKEFIKMLKGFDQDARIVELHGCVCGLIGCHSFAGIPNITCLEPGDPKGFPEQRVYVIGDSNRIGR